MGSENTLRLPVIDFSKPKLKPGTLEWESVKTEVRQALEEYGFFEALFDKVTIEIRKRIFGALEELFDLPLETKQKNYSEKTYHGYIGQYPQVPLYESMGVEDPDIIERVEKMTNVFWPEGNKCFSESIQSYADQLSELDQTIRRMVLESFGLDKYMEEHMNSTDYLLRFMKYKGPQTSDTRVGLTAHTDKNTVTILHQNQVEGLELQAKNGEWIKAKPSGDSFFVLLGDSFHAWMNGRVHSPHHRVMMAGDDARYSVGLFSIPKGGYIIKAPKELVNEQHPLLFKPFDHFEFLGFVYSEATRQSQYTLKTYCGVSS